VETTIRNSEKSDQGFQVSPSVIQREVEEDLQKSVLMQPNQPQLELEITEEIMKRTERFLRKVAPLVEKELEENLPLYGRKWVVIQVWGESRASRPSSANRGWCTPFRTRRRVSRSCKSQQFRGMHREWWLEPATRGSTTKPPARTSPWSASGASSSATSNPPALKPYKSLYLAPKTELRELPELPPQEAVGVCSGNLRGISAAVRLLA
jgi:hypothetical protein